jgi:hypothetical protein
MTSSPAVRTVLRGLAIAIALVAAADPSITSSRTVRPDVSVTNLRLSRAIQCSLIG